MQGVSVGGDMTGLDYLGTLAARATTTVNAPDYARTIRDLYQRRELHRAACGLIQRVSTPEPLADIVADAEAVLHAVTTDARNERDVVSIGEASAIAVEQANAAYQRGTGILGLSTGLTGLDRALGGLAPGNLIIIAGRPGMGKTSLALNIASNVARGFNSTTGGRSGPAGVAVYSLEMGAAELAMRAVSELSGTPSSAMRSGSFGFADMARMMKARDQLADVPLYIDRSGGLTVSQLSTRARRLKRQKNIELIVIDYLQLIGSGGNRGGNRVQEVTDITIGLKALAKELDVPVVALSQLSRKVEDRADKRPQLSDLRESGSIEQDADIVLFVYREEYYIDREKPGDQDPEFLSWMAKKREVSGKAEAIIAKNRHAPTLTVNLRFDGLTTTFTDGAVS
jgi:replicative DNA helicase